MLFSATCSLLRRFLLVGLVALLPLCAQAATQEYQLTFAGASGSAGTGSFLWDSEARLMTGLNWSFAEGSVNFADSGLTKTIYTGYTRSVGELFFHLFTDPVAFWADPANGPMVTSISNGYFTKSFLSGPVTGSYPGMDMLGISYVKGDGLATYEILDLTPSRVVLGSGTISALPVPEPSMLGMLTAGLVVLGVFVRTRRA